MKAGTRKSPRKATQRKKLAPVTDPFDEEEEDALAVVTPIPKGGVACPFPWRLHEMLEFVHKREMEHIVSWENKGKAFTVHDSKAFVTHILPRFFSQTKYASFQRQLNLYGFSRKRAETSLSCYFHPFFLREDPDLVRNMVRCKIKGTGKNRQQGSPKSAKKSTRKPRVAPPKSGTPATTVPSTPVSVEQSSSTSEDNGSSTSSIATPEDQDVQPSESSPGFVTSFPFDGEDDDEGLLCDAQMMEHMVFFEGSPFHLLEPEPVGPVLHDEDIPHSMAGAPSFPHSSFRAVMPRMKLQPRPSSHNGLISSDFLAGLY